MKRKTRMYEPWGYQDENNYESSEIIHENDLASFFADVNYNKDDNKIHFQNKDGEEVGSLDVNEFVKSDSIIDHTEYADGILKIFFTNGDVITINLSELLDENEFKDGLVIDGHVVKVLIDGESDKYLSVSENGVKVAGVEADIEAEKTRAEGEEQRIEAKLDGEISRAIAEEERIDAKLDQEIADRIADVDAEETRAKAEETTINNTIGGGFSTASTETITAKFNALSTALDTEIGNRTTQDNQLQNNINTESTARQAADTRLENLITDERNRAVSAETALNAKINQEIDDRIADVDEEQARAEAAEAALQAAISAEEARAISAETNLQTAIDTEAQRATEAETNLQAAIEAEGQRAQDAETALDEKIDDAVSALTDAIAAEENRAGAAEAELEDAINNLGRNKFDDAVYDSSAKTINFLAEDIVVASIDASDFVKDGMIDDVKIENDKLVIVFNTDAGKETIEIPLSDIFNPNNYYTKDDIDRKESVLQEAINVNSADISAEENRAISSETNIISAIAAEENRAESVEQGLQESINSEASTARAAEQANANAIAAEKDRAEAAEALKANSADVYTKGEIDGKENALQAGIDANAATIEAEEFRALSAETDLQEMILETESALTESINLKADANTVYTQEEVDALLLAKENEIYNLTKIVGDIGGAVTYDLPSPAGKSFNTLMNNNGTVKLTDDVTTGRFGPGITAKNKAKLNLNNNDLTITGLTITSAQGGIMARGTQEITIGGKGTIDTGNGICIEGNGADSVINLTGSTTVYQTDRSGGELIYCYAGTINITNGTFRNNGDDKTYMLNCYDANYRAGTAKIVVTGGKFYDFDPGNNTAEGPGTSFLAPGYHTEASTVVEEGVEHTVYTVKAD